MFNREALNLPNAITIVRILATPFVLWMLIADNGEMTWLRWAAAILFTLFMATDALDGYLARSRGLITDLGKLLDPIADKFLTGGALVALSILGELPWYVTVIVLVREIGITVHRLVAAHHTVIAAAILGKLKTVAQSIAIPLAVIPHQQILGDWSNWLNIITMTVAVLLTIISGIDYIIGYVKGRRQSDGTS